MLSRFHLMPERIGRKDGRTDRRTDRTAISISRVSVLTRDAIKTMTLTYRPNYALQNCVWSIYLLYLLVYIYSFRLRGLPGQWVRVPL